MSTILAWAPILLLLSVYPLWFPFFFLFHSFSLSGESLPPFFFRWKSFSFSFFFRWKGASHFLLLDERKHSVFPSVKWSVSSSFFFSSESELPILLIYLSVKREAALPFARPSSASPAVHHGTLKVYSASRSVPRNLDHPSPPDTVRLWPVKYIYIAYRALIYLLGMPCMSVWRKGCIMK